MAREKERERKSREGREPKFEVCWLLGGEVQKLCKFVWPLPPLEGKWKWQFN